MNSLYHDIKVNPFEVLCIELGEELLEKRLVNPTRFTFQEIWKLQLRTPSTRGRRINPALSKTVVRDILLYLVALNVLIHQRGTYRFVSTDVKEWEAELLEPYIELFLGMKAHGTMQ